MEISAPESSLPDRPRWAIWVTRVLGRREDRTSISFHTLADLGRNGWQRVPSAPAGSATGRSHPLAPGRPTLHLVSHSRRPRQEWLAARSERSGGERDCRLEPSAAGQHAPGDAGELVGQCDRQHVVMEPLPGRLDPRLEPVPLPVLLSDQHDPGSLDEEGPQVAVAAFRYRAEDGAIAGRHLPRDQPQPGGKVAPFGEGVAVADCGHHGARDDWADPRDTHQPLAADIVMSQKRALTR